jgi:small subunit ribosomal protein S5
MSRANDREKSDGMLEKLVAVNRVSKTVKGGKQFGFTALTVVGDGNGKRRLRLRQGARSAGRHPEGDGACAQEHGQRRAEQRHAALRGQGRHGAAKVYMQPASEGTGVIAGGAMRAVFEWWA